MKIYVIFLSMVFGTVQAQQQKPAGFHIEGHVKGISEKSLVSITDANKPTDTLARGFVKGRDVRIKWSCKRTQSDGIEFFIGAEEVFSFYWQ